MGDIRNETDVEIETENDSEKKMRDRSNTVIFVEELSQDSVNDGRETDPSSRLESRI